MSNVANLIPDIECVQVNLRKSSLATGLFSHKLSLEPRIGLVSEPYTAFKKVVGKPSEYIVFPEITMDASPRTAIYIPRTIKNVGMPQLSNADCQVALLYLQIGAVLIASVYLDINLNPTPNWLYDLTAFAENKQYSLLIAMDSNAHSTLYGPTENERGRNLERFILDTNLWVANRGITPTFQTIRAESFIDVTLTRDVNVYNWRVSTEYNASDHNSLLYSICGVEPLPARQMRPWKQANWNKFNEELRKTGYTVPQRIDSIKLDKMVDYLHLRINDALDIACPKFDCKPKFKGTRWFNSKLKKMNIQIRKQNNIAKRVGTWEERNKYFRMHRKFKYKCRKARTNMWRQFVTETDSEHMMSRLAKISQHRDRAQLHTLQKSDGSFTEPGVETITELARSHFPAAISDDPIAIDNTRSLTRDEIETFQCSYLSVDKVRASLEKFHPYKAPGPDGIKAIAYKHFPQVVYRFLYVIYLACIKLHHTPVLWQEAMVVFLPKPNKPNYVLGKYFRPIVLSNGFLKGLERIFTWRMDFMLKYYPIHNKQHGFTKGKSTESAISNTVDYIERCLFKKKSCIGVFLDISSAYDSIDIEHIRNSLYKHSGKTDLVEWYYHYLSHRKLIIQLHGDRVDLWTRVGFPQGGVASAKFWLLAFDPAIQIINSTFVEGNGYADDCCVVFGGRKPEILIHRIQRVLDRLVEWGRTCGLRFNPDKTIVVNFTRNLTKNIPHLRVDNEFVPYSTEATYLGLKIDAKLLWRKHVNERIAKSKRYLMKMSNISKAIWGPKPHLSRWVYRCVVRPMIVYGSLSWAHITQSETIQEKLRKINRLAIATYTLFPRSTPTRAVELITDTFPLHLWLEKEALCTFIRLAKQLPLDWAGTNSNKRHNIAHRRFWANKLIEYDITDLLLEVDTCYTLAPVKRFKIRTDSFHKDPAFLHALPKPRWDIYTDGSKSDGKVGAAFIIYHKNDKILERKYCLPNSATVFQAETFAIFQAIIALKDISQGKKGMCFIKCDSMSVLQSFKADEIHKMLTLRTIDQLNSLAYMGIYVSLFWVKAHVGVVGNEEADRLAKAACEMSVISYVPLPKSHIRSQVLQVIREKWVVEWDIYEEARHSKLFIQQSDKLKGKQCYSLGRIDLRRLIMAITNHNDLRYHQSLHDNTINPTCRFCRLFDESFDHLLECDQLQDTRRTAGILWSTESNDQWGVHQLLTFINTPEIQSALDSKQLNPIPRSDDHPASNTQASPTSRIQEDPDSEIEMDIETIDNEQGHSIF